MSWWPRRWSRKTRNSSWSPAPAAPSAFPQPSADRPPAPAAAFAGCVFGRGGGGSGGRARGRAGGCWKLGGNTGFGEVNYSAVGRKIQEAGGGTKRVP